MRDPRPTALESSLKFISSVLLVAVILGNFCRVAHGSSGRTDWPQHTALIRFDPGLFTGALGRGSTLTEADRSGLNQLAAECLRQARVILASPSSRRYFLSVYHLDPIALLDRPGFGLVLRTFPVRWDVPTARRTVQVGAYFFGEMTISVNIQLLLACLPNRDIAAWERYISGVIVHEMAHLADYVDDGLNNDGSIGTRGEEGDLSQQACGARFPLPAPLERPESMLAAWHNARALHARIKQTYELGL